MSEQSVSFRPPQQDRSRRALRLVLNAAEDVLGAKGFDDFTMTAVAQEAGVSIGAIYRRFEGKDQLLAAVKDRLLERMEADLAAALQASDPSLAGVIHAFVRASVDDLSGNPAFPYLFGPSMALTSRVREAIAKRRQLFLEAVTPHLSEVRRTDPGLAVAAVQAIVTGSCVHRASQGRGLDDGLPWAQFAEQINVIAMLYLLTADRD